MCNVAAVLFSVWIIWINVELKLGKFWIWITRLGAVLHDLIMPPKLMFVCPYLGAFLLCCKLLWKISSHDLDFKAFVLSETCCFFCVFLFVLRFQSLFFFCKNNKDRRWVIWVFRVDTRLRFVSLLYKYVNMSSKKLMVIFLGTHT